MSSTQRQHQLTPRGQRVARLSGLGVPSAFVATVGKLSTRSDVLGILRDEKRAYSYLTTSDWDDLTGAEVTPLVTGCNGDTFYLVITRDERSEFVFFGLESGIRERFSSFDDLAIHIMESVAWDLETDQELAALANDLGFSGSIKLSDLKL